MHGFGTHTYSFINAQDERVWVKFHFKTLQGIANISDARIRQHRSAPIARATSATCSRRSSAATSRAGA